MDAVQPLYVIGISHCHQFGPEFFDVVDAAGLNRFVHRHLGDAKPRVDVSSIKDCSVRTLTYWDVPIPKLEQLMKQYTECSWCEHDPGFIVVYEKATDNVSIRDIIVECNMIIVDNDPSLFVEDAERSA